MTTYCPVTATPLAKHWLVQMPRPVPARVRLGRFLVERLLDLLALIPLGVLRSLGSGLGRLSWWLRSASAKVTRLNLARCYPELSQAQQNALAKQSLGHTASLFTEAGVVWRWSATRAMSLIQQRHGEEELKAALADDQGTLLLIPHLGNWEFLSPYFIDSQLTALYDPPRIRALDDLIRAARQRQGISMLPIDRSGIRGIMTRLKEGGFVVLLPDQVPARDAGAVHADFFGQPALTMTLAHQLARRTKPKVLIGAALRCPGGFRVHFERLDDALMQESAESATTHMNRAIEDLAREEPAQYQWEYKRFRRPPAGTPDMYKEG